MSALEFAASVVSSVAWPLAVLAIAALLRAELLGVLRRLSQIKHKDLTLNFERLLEEAEDDAASIEPPTVVGEETAPVPTEVGADDASELMRLAETSPRAAVIESWTLIESAVLIAAEANELLAPRSPAHTWALLNQLRRRGLLTDSAMTLARDLRRLRNAAAHDLEFAPSVDEARRYVVLTRTLLDILLRSGWGTASGAAD